MRGMDDQYCLEIGKSIVFICCVGCKNVSECWFVPIFLLRTAFPHFRRKLPLSEINNFTISSLPSVHIYVHNYEFFIQIIILEDMFQQKNGCFRSRSPISSQTGSSFSSLSAEDKRDILGEGIMEQRFTQQGIPKDQIDKSGVSDIRNIKESIVWLQNQLLYEEGSKLIAGKPEEIRLRLQHVEAELEGLVRRMVEAHNFCEKCRASEDLVNQKTCYIVELEKKIHTYEERLRQATKREGGLEDEVKRLNSAIRAITSPNFSKEELERFSFGTVRQIQVVREKLVPVERIVEKIVEVPVIVEIIVEKVIRVPEIVEVERIVEKTSVASKQTEDHTERRNTIIERIVEKPVPIVQIQEKIVEVPQIRERIVQVTNMIEKPIAVEVIVEKIVEIPKEVERIVEVPVAEPKHRQGLEVIRRCTPEEENLINRQYLKIKHQLEKKSQNIVLYNTYRDGKFSNDPSENQELHQWVKKLIEEIEPGAGCYPVVQTFILNPKENQLTQDYHMDFGDHIRTLFVNMDYITSLNSTQYFKEPLQHHTKLSLRGAKQYGNNEKEILNRENREFIEVSQMICKPFNILLCKPGTVHRGIANRSGVDRVLFSVCYTNVKGYFSGQPKIGTQKEDIE